MFPTLPGLLAASFLKLLALQSAAMGQDLFAVNTAPVLFPAIAQLVPAPATAVAALPAAQAVSTPIFKGSATTPAKTSRPALLPSLYVTQVGLQAMDIHSTMQAMSRGAHEANPMMQDVVNNRGAMLAVKAGAAAGTILISECLWRKDNRTAAIVSMIIANGITAVVVAHNYRLANDLAH